MFLEVLRAYYNGEDIFDKAYNPNIIETTDAENTFYGALLSIVKNLVLIN